VSEHLEPGPHDADAHDLEQAPLELTGHGVVDEVLESMQGLENRPVEEHVAVFEAAHEKLRSALAEAGDRPNGTSSGS
jgi:hypothetical protein